MATKDYAAIARSKIIRPANIQRQPRLLVYGRNKKGKTYLGASAPNVLILDPEGGTDTMKTKNPHVWPVLTWQEFEDVYRYLKLSKHPYDWVSVDGLTKFSNMSLRYVMGMAEERDLERKPGMVQKQDYGKAGELMKGMLHNFHSLDKMGVVFTAQERMVEVSDDGEEDEEADSTQVIYVPDLPKGVRSSVTSLVDLTGRMYTVKIPRKVRRNGKIVELDEKVIQRRMWIEPVVQFDTGYRSDFVLPPYVKNPTVPRVVELMLTGPQTEKG